MVYELNSKLARSLKSFWHGGQSGRSQEGKKTMTERSYENGYGDRYDQARRESGRFGRYLSTRSPETWMFFVAGVFLGGFFF
jgi:hypothetical protein